MKGGRGEFYPLVGVIGIVSGGVELGLAITTARSVRERGAIAVIATWGTGDPVSWSHFISSVGNRLHIYWEKNISVLALVPLKPLEEPRYPFMTPRALLGAPLGTALLL